TPCLLGNDFADQYNLSIIRKDGEVSILFGDTGRSAIAQNSLSDALFKDAGGQVFHISSLQDDLKKDLRRRAHRARARKTRKEKRRKVDPYMRAYTSLTIAPESSCRIPVDPIAFEQYPTVYAERL